MVSEPKKINFSWNTDDKYDYRRFDAMRGGMIHLAEVIQVATAELTSLSGAMSYARRQDDLELADKICTHITSRVGELEDAVHSIRAEMNLTRKELLDGDAE